jgi:beta-xylosidase
MRFRFAERALIVVSALVVLLTSGASWACSAPATGSPRAVLPAANASPPSATGTAPAERTGPGVWGDQGNGSYRNPVLNADFSDPDVIRVGSDYYLVGSDFHYMGMTILHSTDLVNWHYLARVYDRLDISPHYDTPLPTSDPNTRYGKGSWAPALRYHAGRFWIYFCTPTEGCYMTTARNAAGPWAPLHAVKTYAPGEHPWEDPCPFWDDDGHAYLGHSLKGAGPIIINRMSPDGRTLLDDGRTVYTGPNAEGTKIYKRHGYYYLIIPQNGFTVGDQWVLRATNIYGPYTSEAGKPVLDVGNGVTGPHQGGLVETPTGQWWFMHFETDGAIGRVDWLEPARWTRDGWLRMGVDVNGDGIGEPVINYPKPDVGRHARATVIRAPASNDDFSSRRLGLQWEWNHNPVDDHWSLTARPGYLRLEPVGAASDAFLARNTLTQKLLGRIGVVTTELDTTGMVDGQDAGLLHIGASGQWVGVERAAGVSRIKAVVDGAGYDGPMVTGSSVWLRTTVNLDGTTYFAYSLDGIHFTRIGDAVKLVYANWKGDKIGLFTDNSLGSGGGADFNWFSYAHDGPGGGLPRSDLAPGYRYAGPLTFTGSSDSYVDAGPTPYEQTSELTASFTMRPDRLADMVPLDKLPATADGRAGGYAVELNADGSLDWRIGGAASTGVAVHVPHGYAAGRTEQVTCTLAVGPDGIPVAKVYLDGVLRGALPGVGATVMNTATTLRLGAPSAARTDERYAGTLADVRIWTRALSGAQVDAMRSDRTPPTLRADDIVTHATGPDGARVDLARARVTDAEPTAVTTDAPPRYFRYPAGTTTITWTATDVAGNTATAIQHVIVIPHRRRRP